MLEFCVGCLLKLIEIIELNKRLYIWGVYSYYKCWKRVVKSFLLVESDGFDVFDFMYVVEMDYCLRILVVLVLKLYIFLKFDNFCVEDEYL